MADESPPSATYVLGIDGGGTRTVALLADDAGRILGRGTAGPSNYNAVGLEAASASLGEAARQAWQAAGLAPGRAALALLGLSGVDRPADRERLQATLAPLGLARRLVLINDAIIALAAGNEQGVGVVVIAGTGSIAYGRNRRGETRRAGGWGYMLGDEGSAHDIGLQGLRAVLCAHDGRGPATSLAGAILQHWGLAQPQALVGRIYPNYPRLEVAALAPLVEQAARAGDAVALAIFARAAAELARAATAVVLALGMAGDPLDIVLSGSVFRAGDLVTGPFLGAVQAVAPQARAVRPENEPAVGAVRLALAALADER